MLFSICMRRSFNFSRMSFFDMAFILTPVSAVFVFADFAMARRRFILLPFVSGIDLLSEIFFTRFLTTQCSKLLKLYYQSQPVMANHSVEEMGRATQIERSKTARGSLAK